MYKLIRNFLTLGFAAAVAAAPLGAQDPGPEQPEKPDLWRILLDLTYSGASGNQDLVFFDGGFKVTRLETHVAEFEAAARARTGTQDGERVAESYQASLKADARPEERWSPFVFASAQRDRFKQLDLRTSAGGGVKYTFVRAEDTEASLSFAVLHSRDDFRPADLPTETDGRLSWRFKGYRELREGVVLENVSFYQPVWDTGSDYLLDSETTLGVQVFSMLAVKASYQFERDSTPPPDVVPNDQYVKLGIQLQL